MLIMSYARTSKLKYILMGFIQIGTRWEVPDGDVLSARLWMRKVSKYLKPTCKILSLLACKFNDDD